MRDAVHLDRVSQRLHDVRLARRKLVEVARAVLAVEG
jgi:hypothetical protein